MLSAEHWQRIHAYQDLELTSLVADATLAEKLSRQERYARIGDWLKKESPGRVLELGCGPGRFVAVLAQLGHTVTGVDLHSFPSWQKLEPLANVTLRDNINAEQLPYKDHSFDYVACLGALLYFKNDNKALSEMWRVLKPGGRLIVRTVNAGNLYTVLTGKKLDPASVNLYSPSSLRDTINDAGFAVADMFTYGFWPPCNTDYWWYLVNGRIPQGLQHIMSCLTPGNRRVNITAFATRNG